MRFLGLLSAFPKVLVTYRLRNHAFHLMSPSPASAPTHGPRVENGGNCQFTLALQFLQVSNDSGYKSPGSWMDKRSDVPDDVA
jgi:hypothetical protein